MTQDWRIYRPAIWLGMIGIALILLVDPPYIGGAVLGGAIGIGLRIAFGRRPVDRARRQARSGGQGSRGQAGRNGRAGQSGPGVSGGQSSGSPRRKRGRRKR